LRRLEPADLGSELRPASRRAGRARPGALTALLSAIIALLLTASVHAAPAPTAAQEAIPFDSLSETNRTLVKAVTDHYTMRRQYAAQEFTGKPAILEWMLDHLHETWILARALDLKARSTRRDEQGRLWTDGGDGSVGYVVLLHQMPGKRIYLMAGSQKKVCNVQGRGIIVVNYQAPKADVVQCDGAQFIRVDNVMMAALTSLFGPFLTGMVDQVYREMMGPITILNALAVTDPAKLRDAIQKLPPEDAALFQDLLKLLDAPPR
jgi:hypothetical protein